MKLQDFFNSEFKIFSSLDNVRSIPSVIDGLKDSQRKAVYGMLQNGLGEIKVAQAAGKFSLLTHYSHGENSMGDTIVGLAQDYPGSNNVNLFEPIGQFGSILSSEASSHRYIYTKPSKYLRAYIKKDDDCILEHRYEDGDKAEPVNFYPVLPMWLVNGSVGIGTGYSVKILPRDPSNVIELLQKNINGSNVQQRTLKKLLVPQFNGWKGKVVDCEDQGKYELHGLLEKVNTTTIKVTELPVGYGVDKFKSILVDLMDKGKVKDFDNNSTEDGFDFTIKVPREVGTKSKEDLKTLFKLVSRQSENVTLWSTDGNLKQYDNVFDALLDFIDFRLKKYEQRRQTMMGIIKDELDFLNSKKLFIIEWNKLDNPGKMKQSDVQSHMESKGVNLDYMDKLMSLRISSLTMDQIKELDDLISTKKDDLKDLEGKTNRELYALDVQGL